MLKISNILIFHRCLLDINILAVFIVFPCSVEGFTLESSNERFKDNLGFFVNDKNIGMYDFGRNYAASFDVFSQEKILIGESRTENSSSCIKLLAPISAKRQEVCEQKPQQESNGIYGWMSKDSNKEFVHVVVFTSLAVIGYLTVICIIGTIIGTTIQRIYYYYT